MTPFAIEHFAITETGPVRKNNEDAFCALEEQQFYALADGMGGHNAGEVAAQVAVTFMSDAVQSFPETEDLFAISSFLHKSVLSANKRIYKLAQQNEEYSGMGTTLSCCILRDGVLIFAHIGDSRLYQMRSTLRRLTEDHSLRSRTPNGNIHACRNVLTRALGTQAHVVPELGEIPLCSGDLYLLCSDGLSDFVPQKILSSTLSANRPLEQMGKELLQTALKNGSNDNITLLLIKVV
jgi:PPM family protein phosphatase